MSILAIVWFGLAALLFAVYAVTDGFDLGAGILYGLTKDAERRRLVLATISPIWSGNEVWLLAAVGSLLAAFPAAYASLLSSLYIPVVLFIVAVLFRALGVELRGKTDSPFLLRLFDFFIPAGSAVQAWAVGLVAGNVLVGLPLDTSHNLSGSWLFFLNPWALGTGFLSLAAFTLHGSLYAAAKGEGAHRDATLAFARRTFIVTAFFLVIGAIGFPLFVGARTGGPVTLAVFGVLCAFAVAGYVGAFLELRKARPMRAFAASALGIAALAGASAAWLFPVLIPSTLDVANAITVANAASSERSLSTILVLAGIAIPLVAIYTAIAYRSFRGKVGQAAMHD
jgi:cytochrome d ubiquinol oxidase subunit II